MTLKVGINGFGRIGKLVLDSLLNCNLDVEVVAINTRSMSPEYIAYLIKYDTIQGTLDIDVISDEDSVYVGGSAIKVLKYDSPEKIPWGSHEVDYVFECTGNFTTIEGASKHLVGGAKRVIISAPSKDAPMFVYGVNEDKYTLDMKVVSGASCTTNCLAPILKVIQDNFGIKEAFMSTIHAMTSTQKVVDGNSKKSWRGGRAASQNIIPESTGAATAIGKVIPELEGRIKGKSFRVPVLTGSVVDICCITEVPATFQDICDAIKFASEDDLIDVLGYTSEQVVSSDFIGDARASIFDEGASSAISEHFFNLVAWYDNEYGYVNQLVSLATYMAFEEELLDVF